MARTVYHTLTIEITADDVAEAIRLRSLFAEHRGVGTIDPLAVAMRRLGYTEVEVGGRLQYASQASVYYRLPGQRTGLRWEASIPEGVRQYLDAWYSGGAVGAETFAIPQM